MQLLKLKPRLVLIVVGLVLGWGTLTRSVAAEGEIALDTHAAKVEHSIPSSAVEVGRIGAFPITNSMLVTWGVAALLIIFAQIATRNMKGSRWRAEFLGVAGGKFIFVPGRHHRHTLVKKTFWFFATIFIFIFFSNWSGFIPGFGTIGCGEKGAPKVST